MNPNTDNLIVPEQPPEVAKMLDALPGLIGAIDQAVVDASGKRQPFVLLVFVDGGAVHATNMEPAQQAYDAIRRLAHEWDRAEAEGAGAGDAAG